MLKDWLGLGYSFVCKGHHELHNEIPDSEPEVGINYCNDEHSEAHLCNHKVTSILNETIKARWVAMLITDPLRLAHTLCQKKKNNPQ